MGRKKVIVIICIVIVFIGLIFLGIKLDEDNQVSQNVRNDEKIKTDKIVVTVFYGEGCSHCDDLFEYLDNLDSNIKEQISIEKYEIWSNKDNYKLFEKTAKLLGDDVEGVPYTVIDKSSFKGYSDEIGEKIKTTIEQKISKKETTNNTSDSKDSNSSKENESTTNSQNTPTINFSKMYMIAQLGNGKTAKIGFAKDGTCNPVFFSFNNCKSTNEFCVFYQRNQSPCTYTMENNIISVNWDDIYEMTYKYKLGNGQSQTSVIESNYIMKGIKFEYFPDKDYIDTINGKWDVIEGEGFYKVVFTLNE